MNCYLVQPSTNLLMDRRKSFPGGTSQTSQYSGGTGTAENIDIDIVVSSLCNNNATRSPIINDFFSARLQELDLGHRYINNGQDQQLQYRSTSSLSSNSGQSSRRQSFSSVTSNSCCNNSSSGVNNCCGFNVKQGSTYHNHSNSSGTKRFSSLLRARLLNMSQTDEEPSNFKEEPIKSPNTLSDHCDPDLDEEVSPHVSDHEYQANYFGRRRSSVSVDEINSLKHERSLYPCVGPFEKKRKIAREQKIYEGTDTGSPTSSGSLSVSPKNTIKQSKPISGQQHPINLCKQDEEIALGLDLVERMNLNPDLTIDENCNENDDIADYPLDPESWYQPYTTETGKGTSISYPIRTQFHNKADYFSSSQKLSSSFPPGSTDIQKFITSGPSRISEGKTSQSQLTNPASINNQRHSPQPGTSTAFYNQKHSPQPGTSTCFLHPELGSPSSLYCSGTYTQNRSPESMSSASSYHRSPESEIVPTPHCSPQSICSHNSQPTTSPASSQLENQARVTSYLNLSPELLAPRFVIGLADLHSPPSQREGISQISGRHREFGPLLNEFQIIEQEAARSEQIEESRSTQPRKMNTSEVENFQHNPCEEPRRIHHADIGFNPEHEFVPIQPESDKISTVEDPKKTGKGGAKKNGKKVLQCPDCPKSFSQLRNYRYHRSRHEGTDVFQCTCPECGKKFNDKGYLSSHLKIHKNAKEYQCEYCEKCFNQRVAYNMHVRIHTGVKPHQCTYCEKAFSRKMLLRQHLRTHTGERPYSCSLCGKAFADRSNMLLHQKLHSGNRPYACPQCDKTFSKNHHLKTHLNHHLGIKPYACTNCGHTFSQSSNMKTHMKKCVKTAKKGPAIRAVKTPCPGKATATPTNKKLKVKKVATPANPTTSELTEVPSANTTGARGHLDFECSPIKMSDPLTEPSNRERAMSIDSPRRPTVIRAPQDRDYQGQAVSPGTPYKMSRLYTRSMHSLHQTPALNNYAPNPNQTVPAPVQPFHSPSQILLARRASDFSSHASPIDHQSLNVEPAVYIQSLIHSMDRILHVPPGSMHQPDNFAQKKIPPSYQPTAPIHSHYPNFPHPQLLQDDRSHRACMAQLQMLTQMQCSLHSNLTEHDSHRSRSHSFVHVPRSGTESHMNPVDSYNVRPRRHSSFLAQAEKGQHYFPDLAAAGGPCSTSRMRSFSAGQQWRQRSTERRTRMSDPMCDGSPPRHRSREEPPTSVEERNEIKTEILFEMPEQPDVQYSNMDCEYFTNELKPDLNSYVHQSPTYNIKYEVQDSDKI